MTLSVDYDGGTLDAPAVLLGQFGLTSAADSTPSFGNVVIDDPGGSRTIVGHRPIAVEESDCTTAPRLFTGYVGPRTYSRGTYRDGDSRIIDATLVDQNAVLGFRLITGADGKRPAETHIERIDWLLGSSYLSGLIVDNGEVYRGNPRPYGEADYRGQYPFDVLSDIAAPIFQTYFAYWDQSANEVALFFNAPTATVMTSTLTISNVLSDGSATCFYPIVDAALVRDPSEVYSTVRMTHKYGTVLAHRASTATAFIERGLQVNNDRIGQASALVMSESLLDRSADEADTISCMIQLPSTKVGLIDAGMRIGVRFTHLPGFETLTYSRVTQRNITQVEGRTDLYNVSLELSTHGLSPGGGGAGGFPFQGECSVTPAQVKPEEELGSSTIQIDISAPTPGRILIAYVWGRGTITGTPGASDDGATPTWTEHPNSPLTPAGGSSVILRAYQKVAIGDETLVTLASGGSGNKSAGCVFEIPASAIAERTTNSGAGAGPPQPFSGTLASSRKLQITGTVFNADDISHDYAGTVAGATEVFDGTVDDNFSPGYWLGYAQDSASISGSWNHNNGWASLNYGIDCDASGNLPIQGQEVGPETVTMTGDSGTTAHPFADGSLRVYVDDTNQTSAIDTYDGTTGDFTLAFTPTPTETVVVWYQSR